MGRVGGKGAGSFFARKYNFFKKTDIFWKKNCLLYKSEEKLSKKELPVHLNNISEKVR